jgi:hypothetical protein
MLAVLGGLDVQAVHKDGLSSAPFFAAWSFSSAQGMRSRIELLELASSIPI